MDSSLPQPSETSGRAERPEFTAEQETLLLRAACRRVAAAVRREPVEPARQLLGPIADAHVYGAFVTLRREGQLRACCGHLGPKASLGKALDHAAQRSATDDPRFPPIARSELNQLDVDVWILWGPEPVAARGEDRVQAVTIGKHGVQIERGPARGLLLPGVAVDHGFDARTFLEQVCAKAGLPRDAWKDDDATLLIFEGRAIHGRFADACPPAAEDDVRPAAVAGGFYPGNPRELQHSLDELFASVAPSPPPEAWAGALAPHAGWVYSGRLAAAVFSRIAIPDCVVVLCPKHRREGARWAVAPHRRWLFPGGELASDPELAARLADGIDGLELDAEAHRQEHAIEVQLPLLARLAPRVRVVGIAVGEASLPELLRFGVAMSVVLRDMPQRPLIVVSSDMNHFANDAETRRLDSLALNAIATRDPEVVYETVRQNRITMCGMAPCVVAMESLRWLGCLDRCESVGHATSADADAPTDRVVGYAGLLFG